MQLAQNSDGSTIHTVQGLDSHDNMTVDLTEATLGQDGQIIITGEDGQGMLYSIGPHLYRLTSATLSAVNVFHLKEHHNSHANSSPIVPFQVILYQ